MKRKLTKWDRQSQRKRRVRRAFTARLRKIERNLDAMAQVRSMSELFNGAVKRFKVAATSPVNVRVTIAFTPDAYKKALKWSKERRFTYGRDGELGGMLLAALGDGVLDPDSFDFDFEEEMDVDVENA